HILPILKGTTVDFLNSDEVKHNVFSPDKIADKFNLGTYGKGVKRSHTFDKVGVAVILCNVHTEMEAYIVVLPTPFFAMTDGDGNFRIENVHPGEYTIKTWHEKMREVSQNIRVEPGKITELNIVLKRRR
ncbi:MAG: carboxypeptidase regulatory-like domain-containing protein, partial [Fidelibacterota bacterium]